MRTMLLVPTTIVIVILAISLLNEQAPALAQRPFIRLTPTQAQEFSRDLVRSTSLDFFRQGQGKFEEEIRILTEESLFSPTPILKIEQVPQLKGDFLSGNSPNVL